MIKNPVTLSLSQADRERRQQWREYQLLCGALLQQFSAAELMAMRRKLESENIACSHNRSKNQ